MCHAKSSCRCDCGCCGWADNTDKLKLALLCSLALSQWENRMNFVFDSNWATRASLSRCRHRQGCRASVVYYAKWTCRFVYGCCGRDDNTDKLKLTLLCSWLLSNWANISSSALSLDVSFVLGSIKATRANLSLLQTSADAAEQPPMRRGHDNSAKQQQPACVWVGKYVRVCTCLCTVVQCLSNCAYTECANSKSFFCRYLQFVLSLSPSICFCYLFSLSIELFTELELFPLVWFVIVFYFRFLLWLIIVFYSRLLLYSFLFVFASYLCFSFRFSWFALAIRQKLCQMSCIMRNARAISKCLQTAWEWKK